MENRNINDEERISQLEKELEETILLGEESDRKFEEVSIFPNFKQTNNRNNVDISCTKERLRDTHIIHNDGTDLVISTADVTVTRTRIKYHNYKYSSRSLSSVHTGI